MTPPPTSSSTPEKEAQLHAVTATSPETLEKRTDQLHEPSASAPPASSRALPTSPTTKTKRHRNPTPTTLTARLAPFATYLVTALVIALLSILVGLKTSPRFATFAADTLARMSTTTTTSAAAVPPTSSAVGGNTPEAVAPSGIASAKTTYTPGASSSAPPKASAPPQDAEPAFKFKGNFRDWNRLADGMDRFHSHFRWEYKNVYENALGGYAKKGQTLPRFLREAEQLAHHLDMHHRIEEAYIFPLLAKKMPQFKDGGRDKGAHIRAHKGIHDGLERYQAYINACKSDADAYDGEKLRAIMDGFHDVLFNHLDTEVADLGAESVQRAGFTLDELKRFPM